MTLKSLPYRLVAPVVFATFFLFFLGLSLQSNPTEAAGNIIYVNHAAVGSSNGITWTHAYQDLQDALGTATAGDEIWVASGVYTPGVTVSDTFQLVDGVALYGGFAATETARAQRNWETNITVLSGDIGGDDITDANGVVTMTIGITETDMSGGTTIVSGTNQNGDNSLNVIRSNGVSNSAVLDGFTVTAGSALGNYPHSDGGGMSNVNSSPAINNVTFAGNIAIAGGGMANNNNSNPLLNALSFHGNYGAFGGGLTNFTSNPTLTNIIFYSNSGWNGAGMMNWENSNPDLSGVVFKGNVGFLGGGLYNYKSNPILNNIRFIGNSAHYTDGFGSGGGMVNELSSPMLINVVFSGNSADHGGGMQNYEQSNPTLLHVTFANNLAAQYGGGLINYAGSNPAIINSIFWNNQDSSGSGTITASIYNEPEGYDQPVNGTFITASVPIISYSLIQGSGGSLGYSWDRELDIYPAPTTESPHSTWNSQAGFDGGNNIDLDPLFETTPSGNLQLQVTSPAINAGNTLSYTSPITTDLAGNARIQNSIIDIGAYEFQFTCPTETTTHVNHAVSGGNNNGRNWADAYSDLQDALLTAKRCANIVEVWVASGIYTPGETISDTFFLLDDVAIYGGFTGLETSLNQRDWKANITVLSGDIHGDDITDTHGIITTTDHISGANNYHVVAAYGVTNTAVLDGFTLTGGQAIGPSYPHERGGGLITINASPAMRNLHITGNLTRYIGGGTYHRYGTPHLTDSIVSHNFAGSHGGGVRTFVSNPTLIGVIVTNNNTNGDGGGVGSYEGDLTLIDVEISNNHANGYGGGIGNVARSKQTLTNVSIINNSARYGGGGVDSYYSTLTVTNSTISGNISESTGGGIRSSSDTLTVINSTISDNTASLGGGIYKNSSTLTVTNSIIANSMVGSDCFNIVSGIDATNLDSDGSCGDAVQKTSAEINLGPLQTNGGPSTSSGQATWTQALLPGSVAIDAGNSTLATDQRGIARPQGSLPDIGAYELIQNTVTVAKSGNGAGAITSVSTPIDCGITCTATIIENSVVTLTATADIGSNFTGWSGDISGSANPITLTIDAAKNVTAAFTLNDYPLTTNTIGTGSGSIIKSPNTPTHNHGTIVILTAVPATGSAFTGWSGGGCTGTGNCSVLMNEAKSVSAFFSLNSYTLTASSIGSGSGSVTKSPNTPTHNHGTIVILTAIPATGSAFTGWSGGGCIGIGNCSVLMNESKSVSALFSLNSYTLTASSIGSGSGSISQLPNLPTYTHGTTVTLTANPAAGSTFASWSDPSCDTTNPCILTIQGARTVSASFALIPTPVQPVSTTIYLPIIIRAPELLTHFSLAPAVPSRPIVTQGETFYSAEVNFPAAFAPGTAYLSASQTALEPVLVDDVVEFWVDSNLVFKYDFSANGPLTPELLQLTAAQLAQLQGHTVKILYKDKYAVKADATPLFLVIR